MQNLNKKFKNQELLFRIRDDRMSEDYLEFTEDMVKHINEPFEGLFGNNVQTRVVQELTADPYNIFRPKDLENLADASTPSIRKSLKNLTELGIVDRNKIDSQHPIFKVNLDSKILKALTFLSFALIDDREGTEHMDQAVIEYCRKETLFPYVQASTEYYEIEGESTSSHYQMLESSIKSNNTTA